jgi:hypothetical protein
VESGTLSLTGRGRLVSTPYGSDRTLPVNFVGLPGTPLTITGAPTAPLAVALGGTASLDLGQFELQANYDAYVQPHAISHIGRIGLHGNF